MNSTIFTTKNKELAIFGKTLTETKGKLIDFFEAFERGGIKGQDGIIDTFFSTNKKSPLTPELIANFERFKSVFNSSQLSAEALAEQMENVDQRIIDYARTCKNGEMTTEGFEASIKGMSLSAKAGKVALQALTTVGNMLIGLAISKGIELAIQGISKLINYQDDLIKKFKEAISAFEQSRDSLNSNKTTIEDISADYAKLAQGVDSLGRNVSLNTEEYSRYNEIVNKIADMFPQMVQGYTDEGNAILVNKGNVEELTKAYEEQKQAYQDLIITKSTETFAGYKAQVTETPWTESIKGENGNYSYIEQKEALEELIAALGQGEEAFTDFKVKMADSEYQMTEESAILRSALKAAGVTWDWNKTPYDYDKLQEEMPKINSYIRTLVSNVNSETAQVKPILTAFIEQSPDYQNLDPKIQNLVKQIIGQFGSEFYSEFDNEIKMSSWVTENIVGKLQGVDGKKIAEAFNDTIDLKAQFQNGEISVEEYLSEISEFKTLIDGFDDKTKKSVDLIFTVNSFGGLSINTMIHNVENKLQDELDGKVGELSLTDLQIAAEEIELDGDDLLTWNELVTKIQEVKDEAALAALANKNYADSISEIKEKTDEVLKNSDIFKSAIEKQRTGESLSYDEVMGLVELDPSLASSFIKTADGYSIAIQTLIDADEKYVQANGVQSVEDILNQVTTDVSNAENRLSQLNKRKAEIQSILFANKGNDHFNANEYNEELLKIDEQVETLTNSVKKGKETIDIYNLALGELGNNVADKVSKSYVSIVSGVESVTSKLEILAKVYNDVKDGAGFDWSSILNNDEFKSTFANCTETYSAFIETITQSPADISACQEAFNNLVTEYINSSGALDELTEETKDATIAMLKQMGIVNAEEAAEKKLEIQRKRNASLAKMQEATSLNEREALLKEAEGSSVLRQELFELALTKMQVNGNVIDTSNEIDQIIALANAAGASTTALAKLAEAKLALSDIDEGKYKEGKAFADSGLFGGKGGHKANIFYEDELAAKNAVAYYEEIKNAQDILKQIQEGTFDYQFPDILNADDYKIEFDFDGSSVEDGNGSGNDSASESAKTFNWIEIAIEKVSKAASKLGNIVSNTFKSWTDRNNSLKKQIKEVNKEIELQQQAYDVYIQKANSVGLPEYWANKVRNGSIDISVITDEGLADKIDEFKEWYLKMPLYPVTGGGILFNC